MRDIKFFTLPYDCGQRGLRLGAGPLHLAQRLGVEAEEITPTSPYPQEVKTAFELYRALAQRLREIDDFPVVLSGHCGASIGAAAGLGADSILWFDAHGDYNTPDTTDTGYLDGMSLAVATGRCWRNLAQTIPGFTPIDPKRVLYIGARDFSPGEHEAMIADGIHFQLADIDATRMLIHVDLDSIDARYGRASHFACEGGPSPDEILETIERARKRFPVVGLVIASYDPSCDTDGRIADAAVKFVHSFC